MNNIVYARCYTSDHLEQLLLEAAGLMVNDEDRHAALNLLYMAKSWIQEHLLTCLATRFCTPDRGLHHGWFPCGLLRQRPPLSGHEHVLSHSGLSGNFGQSYQGNWLIVSRSWPESGQQDLSE